MELARQWEALADEAEELESQQRVTLKPFASLTPKRPGDPSRRRRGS